MRENRIIFYGAAWCGDCIRARAYLEKNNVPFTYIDIDLDPSAADKVVEINKGIRSIPTIVFPDGAVLVEPTNVQLESKLNALP
jgi:mycoredoxin